MLDFNVLISKSKEMGFENIEIIEKTGNSLNIKLFDGKVDKNVISQIKSFSVRAIYNQKMANVNVEDYDLSYEEILNRLKNNATSIESEEVNEIFEGSEQYPTIEKNVFDFDSIPSSKKIELLVNLEKKCKELDNRIVKLSHCAYGEVNSEYHIINSKGLDITKYNKYCMIVVGVIAVSEGCLQDAYHFDVKKTFNELNVEKTASKAVEKAVSMLNAKPIKSGNYKIIFENDAMSDILSAFHGMFTGDNAIKKVTPFLGKENEMIMSSKITIIDNPLLEESISKEPFDDEGVACFSKEVVKNGVLKTMLHSLKTAKYFNTKSTGNGFSSARGIVASGCNFYIDKGNTSKEEMIESLDEGLLITSVDGLHSGVDPISGDFSVKASGFYIEDGKITKPVTLIVISGNFVKMMNDVLAVGTDLEPSTNAVFSPSILFNKLPVSGE